MGLLIRVDYFSLQALRWSTLGCLDLRRYCFLDPPINNSGLILGTFLPEGHVASQLAPELVQGDLLQVGAFKKVCDGLARRVLVDLWSGSGHGHSGVSDW